MEKKNIILLSVVGVLIFGTILQYNRYKKCVNVIKDSKFDLPESYTDCSVGGINYNPETRKYSTNVNRFPFYGFLSLTKNEDGTTEQYDELQLLRPIKRK